MIGTEFIARIATVLWNKFTVDGKIPVDATLTVGDEIKLTNKDAADAIPTRQTNAGGTAFVAVPEQADVQNNTIALDALGHAIGDTGELTDSVGANAVAAAALVTPLGNVKTSLDNNKTSADNLKTSVDLEKTAADSVKTALDLVKTALDLVTTATGTTLKNSVDADKTSVDLLKTATDSLKSATDLLTTATGTTLKNAVDSCTTATGTTLKNAVDAEKTSIDLLKTATDLLKTATDSCATATGTTLKGAVDLLKTATDSLKSATDLLTTATGTTLKGSIDSLDTHVQALNTTLTGGTVYEFVNADWRSCTVADADIEDPNHGTYDFTAAKTAIVAKMLRMTTGAARKKYMQFGLNHAGMSATSAYVISVWGTDTARAANDTRDLMVNKAVEKLICSQAISLVAGAQAVSTVAFSTKAKYVFLVIESTGTAPGGNITVVPWAWDDSDARA